jgi:ABC-type glycerol-3-phosphate transport system permease component
MANAANRGLTPFRIFTYVVLTLAAILYIMPFFFMIGKSFMNSFEANNTPSFVPSVWHPENYLDALGIGTTAGAQRNYGRYLLNTVALEVLSVTGQTVIAILAAYGFARMKFPGRDLLFGIFLTTIFVPSIILLVPNLIIVTRISQWFDALGVQLGLAAGALKWMDNWPALVIPFLANTFSIFLLRQFFKQIPDELWEAARLDGASHLRFLFQIVVPISRAAIFTTILLAFIAVWSALEWPILVTSSDNWRPISVALQAFNTEGGELTNLKMAAAVIAMLPILLLYFLTQRQFTEGIATTGLKG